VAKPNAPEPATEEQLIAHTVSSQEDATDNTASEAPCVDVPKFTSPGTQDSNQAPNAECGQSPSTGVHQTDFFLHFFICTILSTCNIYTCAIT
jgi:hypothetical protein